MLDPVTEATVVDWWEWYHANDWSYMLRHYGWATLPRSEEVPLADLRVVTVAETRWRSSPPGYTPSTLWDPTTPTSVEQSR